MVDIVSVGIQRMRWTTKTQLLFVLLVPAAWAWAMRYVQTSESKFLTFHRFINISMVSYREILMYNPSTVCCFTAFEI